MWHRLSVHVRKQEAGLNQTAVIRPLTNTPDPHSCEPPTTCDLGTDPHPPQEPRGAKPLYNLKEEEDEGHAQRPLWTPTRSGQTRGLESALDKPAAAFLGPQTKGCAAERLQGAVVDTHSSHVPALSDRGEPLSLTPSQLPFAPAAGAFQDEGSEEEEDEELDLLRSYIYDAKDEGEGEDREGEDLTQNKPTLEDSLALSPPSPFRDSVCSGESIGDSSPVMESMLGGCPGSVVYTSNILGDYAHSSSTL